VERLLSVKELSQWIGLSVATLYSVAERRQIPVQRVRRRLIFSPWRLVPRLSARLGPAANRPVRALRGLGRGGVGHLRRSQCCASLVLGGGRAGHDRAG